MDMEGVNIYLTVNKFGRVNPRFSLRREMLLAILCVLGICAMPQRSIAQVLYGTIVGSVADSTGAVIPDAEVIATQLETNDSRKVISNGSGGYTLSTVPAGTYRITVSKAGFTNYTADQVEVRLNSVVRIDASLHTGSDTQTIVVTADLPELQSDRADVSHSVTAQSLEELPQPTRSYQGLVSLVPGVAPPSTNSGGTNNPLRSFSIQANGTSASGTNVRVDGVSATNPWVQFYSTAVPSTDAIQTVSVVTGSADADQGLVNGAAINVQIKSGTNSLHGSLYLYHIDNLLKARPYFLPTTSRLPKLIDNNAGGTIGGPIIKNRLFFFGSYEGDFLHQGNINIATVPTAAIRVGDMSGSANAIYDPATGNADGTGRTAFSNKIIPANRISPITNKIVALIPLPNLPGIAANYYVNTPSYYKLQKVDTKFQYNASQKLNMFVRYSDYPYNVTQGTIFGPILGGGNSALQNGNIYAVSASATYIATPHFVVDALFGLTHSSQSLFPPNTNQRYGSEVLGIPGVNLGDLPEGGSIPQFNVTSYNSLGYAYPALVYNDPVFQYTANATWNRGRHNIRFGFDINQQHINHIEVTPTAFGFTGGVTALRGGPAANQYNSFADFLLGLPQNDTSSVQTVPNVTLRTWQYSPYVSDQWQVSPKVTISYGTRWDYYPVPTRENSGIEYFDIPTKQYRICGKGANPTSCGITVQKTLFSPRFGIAYRPAQAMVVRAGFSLVPEQINMYRDGLYNYPNTVTTSYSGTSSYTAATTLAQGIPVLPTTIDISSGILPLPAGVTFTTTPQHFTRGYTESYNTTVQQDLGKGWISQIAYVGTHTVHQHTRYDLNYGQIGGGAASQVFNNGTLATGLTGQIQSVLPLESMHYNSLQATLEHHFSHGYQVGVAYTWSKWLGVCCDANGDGRPQIQIPQFFNLNRALMPNDRTHNLRISGLFDLPLGKNKALLTHGIAASILGGFQLNSIVSFYSGIPFNLTADATSLNAPDNVQRADQLKPVVRILHGVGTTPYFDTSAYAPVSTARFGTAGFDSLRGPGFANADLGLFRDFHIHERYTLQARIEVLNATNTPHFANPNGNVSSGSFGLITATSAGSRTTDERYVRLGVKGTF
jgi:hypothetical protein